MAARTLAPATLVVLLGMSVGACGKKKEGAEGSSDAAALAFAPEHRPQVVPGQGVSAPTAGGPAPVAIPQTPESVARVVNRAGRPPYEGPFGVLTGTVRLEGDDPPRQEDLGAFAAGCGEAAAMHGHLFRVGAERTLPDVLVTAIGYEGKFVPAIGDAVHVDIRGCAYSKRTIALTFGQRLDVQNRDGSRSYLPVLGGADMRAQLVAIPGGEPVKLYAHTPARYRLYDAMNQKYPWADVWVLPYPTHDVTSGEGRYRIERIPVGKIEVNALLPATMKVVKKELEIREGDNALDLVIPFDAKKDVPKPEPPKPPAGPVIP